MSDIRVGDVVVCVDVSPVDGHPIHIAALARVTRGRFYRVAQAGLVSAGVDCIELEGVHIRDLYPAWPHDGFRAWRFRKIDAADELFTEQMRACRPAKQRVPARAGQS